MNVHQLSNLISTNLSTRGTPIAIYIDTFIIPLRVVALFPHIINPRLTYHVLYDNVEYATVKQKAVFEESETENETNSSVGETESLFSAPTEGILYFAYKMTCKSQVYTLCIYSFQSY